MNSKLDLNALRVFRLVVDAGGFTAAAHRSQRAVSSVSRQIAALERSLGQVLFHRHTRAVELTEAGARYIEAIRPLLDRLDGAAEMLADVDGPLSGVLVINAPVAFGQRQVVPLIRGFSRRHPQIRAELRLTDHFVDPVRSASDITFRVGPLADSALVARPLGPMRYIVAAAPDYVQRHGRPVSPADLLAHDCLRYQGEYGLQRWYWRTNTQEAFQRLDVAGSLSSDDAVSLRDAAVLGQGIVLFPSWLVDRELADGRLVALLEDWLWEVTPEARSVYMVYPAPPLRPRKVRTFVDYVLEQVGEPPVWDRPGNAV